MKCVLILPYFGKFKNYFELFLKSCACNPQIDWLLFTDCAEPYPYPENFKVVHLAFEQFRERIQSRFNFEISLEKPYKLCDCKPIFGYVCEDEIQGYDYWGYCDCDLIFGDLSPLESLMEKGYDKLFVAGHLSLYKNTPENNRVFMDELKGVGKLYQTACSNPAPYNFDEVYYKYSVQSLFEQRGLSLYTKDLSYNCSTKHKGLCRKTYDEENRRWVEEKGRNDQLYWDNGRVLRLSKGKHGAVTQQEFLYIHLQQRTLNYEPSVVRIGTPRGSTILTNKGMLINSMC